MPDPLIDPLDFLKDAEVGMLSAMTQLGAVLVVKAPAADIERCRGNVRILARYELHATAYGPVIRLLVIPQAPPPRLVLEAFCNVNDPQQLREYRDLLARPQLRLVFYDEQLRQRLAKGVTQPQDTSARELIQTALRLLEETGPLQFDFNRAKASVIKDNPL